MPLISCASASRISTFCLRAVVRLMLASLISNMHRSGFDTHAEQQGRLPSHYETREGVSDQS